MGLSIFPKRSSFYFIFVGLRESGVFGRKKIVVERGYCRNFGGVSSALVLDDSDSCSNGESSGEYEPIVPIISRKRLHRCKELGLCSVVVRVYKSLSWEAAREISFERAMERYGLFQSITAFKMLVHIFAYVGMRMEMYALLKDIVFYFQKAEFELDKLLPHLLNSSTDAKISASVVDVLIKVFAANKMLENGVNAYFHARKLGLKLSNFSCNFLLKCLAEASRRELLQSLFEAMKQFGPSPTVYTYTIMVSFYCTQHKVDIEEVANIMEEMITRGISPSVVTYSVYIHGLCRAGCVGSALNFIRDLRHKNQLLNSYCYNAVIHGFCEKGEVVEAMNLFEEMKSCGVPPDVYSYSILIDGFSKCGNVEKGLCLIEEMEARNIKPSLVSYSSLLNGLCRTGRKEKSINLFYKLEESGYKHDRGAYHILINGLCLQGDLVSAHKLLKEMIGNNLTPNIFTLNSIINGYCSEGHIMEALQLIDETRGQGFIPNLHTYNAVIKGLCKEVKLPEGLSAVQKNGKSWD
ncbi:PREDICTED: pentatricopeptide repeat-containing protein At1g05670, mitochondrial-like isoform X2 [Ipomoea nil]|uniref:pentatricopeptide repeat-containing protein At1g05670, mitochondrial-like isoform X2 n=1 Tax=Ipomoea nil TaxID=35883 RepID=UPI000901BB78|nr:PREDICTED: pentatricopeptide repeat-containing protein At1g05670, mitochondrial-like isoform X2 [Ipomoea nil]